LTKEQFYNIKALEIQEEVFCYTV